MAVSIVLLVMMIGVIIGVDLVFLRGEPDIRLVVNVCIVALFGTIELILRRRRTK